MYMYNVYIYGSTDWRPGRPAGGRRGGAASGLFKVIIYYLLVMGLICKGLFIISLNNL